MEFLYPPFQGTRVVKSLRRPHSIRSLKLLFVLHPTLLGLGTFLDERSIPSSYRKHSCKPNKLQTTALPHPQSPILQTYDQTKSIFINALFHASMCHKHTDLLSNFHSKSHILCTYHKSRRRNALATGKQMRGVHHLTNTRPAITRTSPSREEYLNLVDTYRELYSTQAQWMEPTPPPPFPLISSSIPTNSVRPPAIAELLDRSVFGRPPDQPLPVNSSQLKLKTFDQESPNEQQRPDISNLLRVLTDAECDHEEAYKAYAMLPAPGISYLSEEQIRLLFRRLSTCEKKNPKAAMRFLSVVDEMKSQNLPLVQAEWNSAIAFCGQCFARIGAREVEDALLIWREMETEANIMSSNVTFNILFDMAAKAGKFVLADMILKEMETRGLEFNRFFRVGNIYFNGLKGDGDGVRRAYSELVKAGEVVDTVVMNCVIAALISAGELASAENVYDRMKRLISNHAGALLPKPRTWQQDRDLGRLFDRLARSVQRHDFSKKDQARLLFLKQQIPIIPNIHTFTIFIEHHASHTGDLQQISAILSEMQTLGVVMSSRVFLKLFKGFSKHGQEPLTAWTLPRLKSVWESLLAVLDDGKEEIRIGKWMVIWVVRAFHQCGGRGWALHAWEEFRAREKPDHDDLQSTHAILSDIFKAEQIKPRADRKSTWKG